MPGDLSHRFQDPRIGDAPGNELLLDHFQPGVVRIDHHRKRSPSSTRGYEKNSEGWSGRRDLNPRPLAPQASALPGCATPRTIQTCRARFELRRIAENFQHLVDFVLHAPDHFDRIARRPPFLHACPCMPPTLQTLQREPLLDRKSTRLNSSHLVISYAVFCLKKKTIVRSA